MPQVHHTSPQGGVRVVPGHDHRNGGRMGRDRLADHPEDEVSHQPRLHQGLQTFPV